MTGLELIVDALAAGAGAGAKTIATTAVVDAYAGLRDLLRRRLSGREQAERALESAGTEAATWRAELGDALVDSGADQDHEVLRAARQLLELVDPVGARAGKYSVDAREARGVQIGDYNVQTNTFN